MATSFRRIRIRRASASSLAAVVPYLGEPMFATDTGDMSVGDGSTAFASLVKFARATTALTANAVVLGAGTGGIKAVAGITTDGASQLNLGVAGISVGAVVFANATSGSITLQPVTGALGTINLFLPAANDTLVGRATADTLTNKVIAGSQITGAITAMAVTMATARLLGRSTALTGAVEEISIGTGLSLAAGALSCTVAGGMTNPMTAAGDIIIGGSAGTATRLAATTDGWVLTLVSGSPAWVAVSSGSGTVTNTGGNLTSNAIILGAGTVDTKVVAGIITDGISCISLGVAGTSVGKVKFYNATSGSITIQPVAGALGTIVISLPAATTTLVGTDTTDTLTNKTIAGSQVTGAFTAAGLTIATARILGRTTASTGAVEEITIGSGLTLSAGTLTASGGGGSGTVNSGAAGALAFYPSAGTTVDDANGSVQVIVGAASASAATGALAFYGATNAAVSVAIRYAAADASAGTLYFSKARGSIASPGQTVTSDVLGSIYWGGYTSAPAWVEQQATIRAEATENFTGSARGTKLVFTMTAPTTSTNYSAFHLTTTTTGQQLQAFRDLFLAAAQEGAGTYHVELVPGTTGQVRIGTPSSTVSSSRFAMYSSADTNFLELRTAIASVSGPDLTFTHARGSISSPSATLSGDWLGRVMFGGYGASAWKGIPSGIRVEATENWSNTVQGCKMVFMVTTTGGSTRLDDAFTINNNGTLQNLTTVLTDTGGKIISAALNTVAVANGGTGTTNGSITGTGTLTFTAGSSGDVVFDPNTGKVRIGTATSTTAPGVFTVYTAGNDCMSLRTASAGGNGPDLTLSYAKGTLAAPTQTKSGDILGRMIFGGYTGSIWQNIYTGFKIAALQDFTSGAAGGKIMFMLTPNGSTTRVDDAFEMQTGATVAQFSSSLSITFTSTGSNKDLFFTPSGTGDFFVQKGTDNKLRMNAGATNGNYLQFEQTATLRAVIGMANATNDMISGSASTDVVFRHDNSGAFLWATGGAASAWKMKLAASTFSLNTAVLLSMASGTNQRAGDATLVAGTVTVTNATVTANTKVILTRKTSGGTLGTAITYTVTSGSFTVTSDSALDTSTFTYMLVEVP